MSHAADPIPGVQADFKWAPAVPGVGQTVTFESTSQATGIGNAVADYRWDLDGDTGNGYETGWGSTSVITTTYDVVGTVDVRLQVRDTLDEPQHDQEDRHRREAGPGRVVLLHPGRAAR